MRTLLRPRFRYNAARLPMRALKLPVQSPVVHNDDSSRISYDSPTKSAGSAPNGCARSTVTVVAGGSVPAHAVAAWPPATAIATATETEAKRRSRCRVCHLAMVHPLVHWFYRPTTLIND